MRLAISLLATLALIAGCRARTAAPAAAGAAAAKPDLRTWAMDDVEIFLVSKYRDDSIKLTSAANGKFSGTRRSPDGTATLPLAVTVEADRVICEIKTAGMTMRDVVPFEGEIKSNLVEG